MKRKLLTAVLAGVMITGLGTAAFAGAPIQMLYNGKILNSDVSPVNINGRVLAPIRAIAEATGATVTWDKKTNTVVITSKEQESQSLQISNLERALAPKSRLEAVNSWAEGVRTRNGAWQYAVMTPELQKLHYDDFASFGWTTGTSSPWVKDYKVTELAKINADTYRYSVEFTWTDSTNSTSVSKNYVIVKNIDGTWLVASLDNLDVKGEITQVNRKDNKVESVFVENKTSSAEGYEKAKVIIGEETKIYKGYSDEVLKAEDLKNGTQVEVTFKEGPMLKIYPPQATAKTIRVF